MKSTNPNKLLMALMLAGSLCTLPAYAAGVGATTGAGVNTGAGSAGVGTSTDVNGAGTTGTGATGSGTINDPTLMPNSNPTDTTPERMDRTMNKRPNATPTNPSGNRGTNMRNKDCDVNVSSNDPTRNCNDTSKPKK